MMISNIYYLPSRRMCHCLPKPVKYDGIILKKKKIIFQQFLLKYVLGFWFWTCPTYLYVYLYLVKFCVEYIVWQGFELLWIHCTIPQE